VGPSRQWRSVSPPNANGMPASISARTFSRRVRFFFIASRRPGKAGCLGLGELPSWSSQVYLNPLRARGFSDAPSDRPETLMDQT